MKQTAALKQLLVVSQVKYDHQRQAFSKILLEETRLRHELKQLDDLSRSNYERGAEISEMRVIGADLLWQGWLNRSKTTLNIELARLLAIKTHEQGKVRDAFGKLMALTEITQGAEKKEKKAKEESMLANIVEQSFRR